MAFLGITFTVYLLINLAPGGPLQFWLHPEKCHSAIWRR